MDLYQALAPFYDAFNGDLDYKKWADFMEESFRRYFPGRVESVLDLACGTGRMTEELCRRGYDMIGADISEEMLYRAYDKVYDEDINDILFIKQDMRDFELYGTVGAITCCLDSMNYLIDDGDLEKCFSTAHNYLDPNGLLIFDVNTPHKFENIYGNNSYIYEDVDNEGRITYCGWQNDYDPGTKICNFYLSVFTQDESGNYERSDEEQRERCYSKDYLEGALEKCGFEVLGFFADYNFSTPNDDCERWYIVARAIK